MKKITKRIMLIYNLFALPFIPLVMYAYFPEGSFFSSMGRIFTGFITLLFVGPVFPLQMYLIPQIFALILIGLYLYALLRSRQTCPIGRELPAFLGLSLWTILSAVCIYFGCIGVIDGVGQPLP